MTFNGYFNMQRQKPYEKCLFILFKFLTMENVWRRFYFTNWQNKQLITFALNDCIPLYQSACFIVYDYYITVIYQLYHNPIQSHSQYNTRQLYMQYKQYSTANIHYLRHWGQTCQQDFGTFQMLDIICPIEFS